MALAEVAEAASPGRIRREERECSFLLRLPPSILGKLSSGKEGRNEKERDFRSIDATLNPAARTRDFSAGMGSAGVSVGVFVERCRLSLLS